MQNESPSIVQRWSTLDVAPARALDHYAQALTEAVDPMRVASRNTGSFHAAVASTAIGPLTLIRASGSAHRCVRNEADIACGGERSLHLIVNSASAWGLTHRGPIALRAGDAVLLDSQLGHEIELPDFEITHLKLPETWLRHWVPSLGTLAGRTVPHDTRFGRALTAFMAMLTPEYVARVPLPASVIADQVGALLAMTAHELNGSAKSAVRADPVLRDRIRECIVQRCVELALGVNDVAASLNISTRTLHRALAAHGETFGSALIAARIDVAVRMLESPLFDRLTIAEVGWRAGFSDASHFARVLHRRWGRTPKRVRQDRHSRQWRTQAS
jgi:AraC-like DNA-binding protein